MQEIDIVFALLRGALLDSSTLRLFGSSSFTTKDWQKLFILAQRNHVVAMTADAAAKAGAPRSILIPWLAECEKATQWYRHQLDVQLDITSRLKQHGIETLVLKGTHTAQYYPIPEHRQFADLDLYFYDSHDEADSIMEREAGVTVSRDSHHHSKYNYRGVTVESHYDFLNTHYPPSNREYEAMIRKLVGSSQLSIFLPALQALSTLESKFITAKNFQFSTFEILFLLRHMAGHFAASRITLRDLVDWYLTCNKLQDKVDWSLVQETVEQYGMTSFARAVCDIVEHRFDYRVPLTFEGGPDATEERNRVEHDSVYGSVDDHATDGLGRLRWKMRRWHSLAWKRKMVYCDNSISLWFSSMLSHAERPHSILHKQ